MKSSAGSPHPAQEPVGGRRRVAIMDDNPAAGLSLRTFLEDQRCEGLCASNAQEGLELIRRLDPDVIVLDILMERPYSGFQIWSPVKSDPALRHIPLMGISAWPRPWALVTPRRQTRRGAALQGDEDRSLR